MTLKNKTWRIIDIINWSKEYLDNNSVDSPRLTIELMLCQILNVDRVKLYTEFDKPLSESELVKIREMIQLRVKRVPLQYILGTVEFYGEKYFVNKDVLIPRPETEELVQYIINEVDKDKELKIIDIGTGSGCIAISLAKNLPLAEITAVDNSTSALKIAKQNSIDLGVENVKFVYADILTSKPKQKYDIIVSNPPYISELEMSSLEPELLYEPKNALTDSSDGLNFYRRYVTIFKDILSYEGRFYIELNSSLFNEIKDLFDSEYDVNIVKDIFQNHRILVGKNK